MQLDGADVLRHTHKARQTRMVTHTRRALAWIFESAPAHTTPQFSIESSPHPSHSLASNSQFSCLVQACCHTLANAGSSADISGSTSASVALLCALAVAGQPAVHADARYAPAVSRQNLSDWSHLVLRPETCWHWLRRVFVFPSMQRPSQAAAAAAAAAAAPSPSLCQTQQPPPTLCLSAASACRRLL
jgi:hypothetical protein